MKKFLSLNVCLLLLFAASFSVNAQKYFDYEWSKYNLAFTLAEDFKEVTNNDSEFTAVGDGMEFAVFPFNDASVDHSDMTKYTLSVAGSLEMQELDDVDVLDLNGLEGAYVEGYKDGDRVILLGFIDPTSETNFFALITFGDDDNVAEDEAVKMISSLRKK
ncbi:hypothetical protein C7N43_23585 [Sphingobacteriales bacterium UPWRP_1]|nr:hypothetical protein BVG80_09930 [Sphingobacteriales bacterium TSM_CSM]PSJ74515.1 hypothetical protein C7N43_23585 [Sphingobacteriales bacterium UPWRP_1]